MCRLARRLLLLTPCVKAERQAAQVSTCLSGLAAERVKVRPFSGPSNTDGCIRGVSCFDTKWRPGVHQCWAVGPDLIEQFMFFGDDLHNY